MTRVVILGAGAMGCSVAHFLLCEPGARFEVVLIERDPTYAQASSALSVSSIRQQFSSDINARMSAFGLEFIRGAGNLLSVGSSWAELAFVERGYLLLADRAHDRMLRECHLAYVSRDAPVVLLEPQMLRARFPWMSTQGIEVATLGEEGEGWLDGYALVQALRAKAKSRGARFMHAAATGFRVSGGHIKEVAIGASGHVDADIVVNASGPWAASVAAWAGIELPVHAKRRVVFVFESPAKIPDCPLVADPSGVWFRPEGEKYLCGFTPLPDEDQDELPLEVSFAEFETRVWPHLARRVPGFEASRMTTGWAGYYEMNTFDYNAIIGRHPAVSNLYFINGFSGHGLQHSPAAGRAVAELIRHGAFQTLDLTDLSFARIIENRPFREALVI